MGMYFYSINQEKIGPVTLEELQSKNLTKDVLVWKEGLADWVKACDVAELSGFIIKEPPPLPYQESKYEIKEPDLDFDKTHNRDIKVFFIFLLALFLTFPLSNLISSLFSFSSESINIAISILIYIISLVYTINKSEELNKNIVVWSILAIVLPVISAFVISLSRKNLYPFEYDDEDNFTKSQINLEISKTYFNEDFYDEAIYFANKAFELEPKNKQALYLRGELYYKIGRLNLAASDIESCLNQGYAKNRTYKFLAEIYDKKGDLVKSSYYKSMK